MSVFALINYLANPLPSLSGIVVFEDERARSPITWRYEV